VLHHASDEKAFKVDTGNFLFLFVYSVPFINLLCCFVYACCHRQFLLLMYLFVSFIYSFRCLFMRCGKTGGSNSTARGACISLRRFGQSRQSYVVGPWVSPQSRGCFWPRGRTGFAASSSCIAVAVVIGIDVHNIIAVGYVASVVRGMWLQLLVRFVIARPHKTKQKARNSLWYNVLVNKTKPYRLRRDQMKPLC